MSDVFISYSRKDSDFARKLTNTLAESGRDVWVDWEDIARGADWLHEIYAGIEAADTFVFIVSENSLTSEICNREVAHARQHNKRIIPLILQEIRGDIETRVKGQWFDQDWVTMAQENWNAIGHLNWIFFHDESKFDSEFEALVTALETDLAHVKLHTRLLVRAREWETAGRNPSFLLTGDEITSAVDWYNQASSQEKQPAPTELHLEYITDSVDRDNREKIRLRRLRRASWIAGIIGVIAVILTVIAGTSAVSATNQADAARKQVAFAGETLTPIVPTLTGVAAELNQSAQQLATLQVESDMIQSQIVAATDSIIGKLFTQIGSDTDLADFLLVYEIENQLIELATNYCPSYTAELLLITLDVETCSNIKRNEVCVLNGDLTGDTTGFEGTLETSGDITALQGSASINFTHVDRSNLDEWDILFMQTQVNIPDTLPGQNILFFILGPVGDVPIQFVQLNTGVGGAGELEATNLTGCGQNILQGQSAIGNLQINVLRDEIQIQVDSDK